MIDEFLHRALFKVSAKVRLKISIKVRFFKYMQNIIYRTFLVGLNYTESGTGQKPYQTNNMSVVIKNIDTWNISITGIPNTVFVFT